MNAPCPACGAVGDCPDPHACAETISIERGPNLADLLDERDACAEYCVVPVWRRDRARVYCRVVGLSAAGALRTRWRAAGVPVRVVSSREAARLGGDE